MSGDTKLFLVILFAAFSAGVLYDLISTLVTFAGTPKTITV